MQTFTMQFPVTSTVTVGNDGSITITPAAPAPTQVPAETPAEPVDVSAGGFKQPSNVRVHGGDMSFVTSPTGGAGGTGGGRGDTPVMMSPMLVGGYTPEFQTIAGYLAILPADTKVDTEKYTARNIHFGVKAPWGENKHMLTVDGVLINPTGCEDVSARIAVLRYIPAYKTLYVAFHPGVSVNARKVLTSALRGGAVLPHVLDKVLMSGGRSVK